MTIAVVRAAPFATVTRVRMLVAHIPLAFAAAYLAVVVNLADSAIYPASGTNTGSLHIGPLRFADLFSILSLILSVGPLVSGRLRIPSSFGIPMLLAIWVWSWGLAIGLEKHASKKMMFAECHVLLYILAISLAYLQLSQQLLRRIELLLLPIAFFGVLSVLPRGGYEKGGDISTIGAGIATILLVRHRLWVGLPLALVSVALLATGGQRASLLFAGPPLLVALIVALRRTRLTSRGIVTIGVAVALIGAAIGPLAHEVSSQLNKTFNSTAKAQSGSSRIDQLHIAEHQIAQAPWFGQGLGHTYQLYNDNGSNQLSLTDITHDIYVDLTLRFGFVGLAVIVLILLLGIAKLATSWHRLTTYRVILVLLLVSLLIHGAVESILDKPRLAVFAGWLVALLLSSPERGEDAATPTWAGLDDRVAALRRRFRPTWLSSRTGPVGGAG